MHYLDKVEVKIAFNQDMSFLRSLRQGTLKKKSPNYPITGVFFLKRQEDLDIL